MKEAKPFKPALPADTSVLDTLAKVHPRLLVDDSHWDKLKARLETNKTVKGWYKAFHAEAKALLEKPPTEYNIPDGLRLLDVSRAVMRNVYVLALVARVRGKKKYIQRLKAEVLHVCDYPDWNHHTHFLDTAEMAHAVAIAYDWHFDDFTEAEREKLETALLEFALRPLLEAYENHPEWGWFTDSNHNWNQVCNGGGIIAALAIGDRYPAIAEKIIRHAVKRLPLAMSAYAPDGGYEEGVGYWQYGTSYNVIAMASMQTALGTMFDLETMPGLSQTGLFPIYGMGSSGKQFTFSDNGAKDRVAEFRTQHPILFWLAKQYDQPFYSWYEATYGGKRPLDLLWYEDEIESPQESGMPLDRMSKKVQCAMMRSNWSNDETTTYLAVKAGSPEANHSHMDIGSFVFDAMGVRWAEDLGAENYNLPDFFETKKGRWQYYRCRAEAHNTIVINPEKNGGQSRHGMSKIIRQQMNVSSPWTVMDMSRAYSAHAESVQRGFHFIDRKHVLILDEVSCYQPSEFYWFMTTEAEIEIVNAMHAKLTMGDKLMHVKLLEPFADGFEIMPAQPLPSSPNPAGIFKNEAYRKLVLHAKDISDARLAVVISPDENVSIDAKALKDWQA